MVYVNIPGRMVDWMYAHDERVYPGGLPDVFGDALRSSFTTRCGNGYTRPVCLEPHEWPAVRARLGEICCAATGINPANVGQWHQDILRGVPKEWSELGELVGRIQDNLLAGSSVLDVLAAGPVTVSVHPERGAGKLTMILPDDRPTVMVPEDQPELVTEAFGGPSRYQWFVNALEEAAAPNGRKWTIGWWQRVGQVLAGYQPGKHTAPNLTLWARGWANSVYPPETASRVASQRLSPVQYTRWLAVTDGSPEQINAWSGAYCRDGWLATRWIAAGCDGPEDAKLWYTIGVRSPTQLANWRAVGIMSPAHLTRCRDAGYKTPTLVRRHPTEVADLARV